MLESHSCKQVKSDSITGSGENWKGKQQTKKEIFDDKGKTNRVGILLTVTPIFIGVHGVDNGPRRAWVLGSDSFNGAAMDLICLWDVLMI